MRNRYLPKNYRTFSTARLHMLVERYTTWSTSVNEPDMMTALAKINTELAGRGTLR